MTTCSIEGCGKRVRARGWCNAHWIRWKKYGEPLAGNPTLRGEPLRFFQETVLPFDSNECLAWPYAKSSGYGTLWFNGRLRRVSRLVCEARNGPPPTSQHEAAHECGKGHEGCVNPRHLAWKTSRENKADQLVHGTRNRGERQGRSKLTRAQVVELRALKEGGWTLRALGSRYGVDFSTVRLIVTGKNWAWLESPKSTQ